MFILYFHIYQRGFEVLNVIFHASMYVTIVTAIVHYNMYHCYKILDILLVVEFNC